MRTAGFVLVGGQSARMGRDKARLPLASGLLVEGVAAKVKRAAGSVTLVGRSASYRDLPFPAIDDLRPALGPLAGIEAALASECAELNLIVACDMPDLEESWLTRLLEEAACHPGPCLISQTVDGRLHPLCGVWRAECLLSVRRALDANRLRLLDLVRELNARYLLQTHSLTNLNTPEQWAEWQLAR